MWQYIPTTITSFFTSTNTRSIKEEFTFHDIIETFKLFNINNAIPETVGIFVSTYRHKGAAMY